MLGSAFTDDDVDAVILLTDGLMSHTSPDVTKCVAELSRGRPLHIVHINEESVEGEDVGVMFLQTLAVCTEGTLHSIKPVSRCVMREVQLYPPDDDGE